MRTLNEGGGPAWRFFWGTPAAARARSQSALDTSFFGGGADARGVGARGAGAGAGAAGAPRAKTVLHPGQRTCVPGARPPVFSAILQDGQELCIARPSATMTSFYRHQDENATVCQAGQQFRNSVAVVCRRG